MTEPRQARAEVTRRRILDAAVDLFAGAGYGETGLAEIVKQAEVTKGAFYYHFASKEAVATAIIEDSQSKIVEAANRAASGSAAGLESVIAKTFGIARLAPNGPQHQDRQGTGAIADSGQRRRAQRISGVDGRLHRRGSEGRRPR